MFKALTKEGRRKKVRESLWLLYPTPLLCAAHLFASRAPAWLSAKTAYYRMFEITLGLEWS
jgi:hypothetical protein